eukprot:scaffold282967_cov33-Tisochrysis_lutea.AAC.1
MPLSPPPPWRRHRASTSSCEYGRPTASLASARSSRHTLPSASGEDSEPHNPIPTPRGPPPLTAGAAFSHSFYDVVLIIHLVVTY